MRLPRASSLVSNHRPHSHIERTPTNEPIHKKPIPEDTYAHVYPSSDGGVVGVVGASAGNTGANAHVGGASRFINEGGAYDEREARFALELSSTPFVTPQSSLGRGMKRGGSGTYSVAYHDQESSPFGVDNDLPEGEVNQYILLEQDELLEHQKQREKKMDVRSSPAVGTFDKNNSSNDESPHDTNRDNLSTSLPSTGIGRPSYRTPPLRIPNRGDTQRRRSGGEGVDADSEFSRKSEGRSRGPWVRDQSSTDRSHNTHSHSKTRQNESAGQSRQYDSYSHDWESSAVRGGGGGGGGATTFRRIASEGGYSGSAGMGERGESEREVFNRRGGGGQIVDIQEAPKDSPMYYEENRGQSASQQTSGTSHQQYEQIKPQRRQSRMRQTSMSSPALHAPSTFPPAGTIVSSGPTTANFPSQPTQGRVLTMHEQREQQMHRESSGGSGSGAPLRQSLTQAHNKLPALHDTPPVSLGGFSYQNRPQQSSRPHNYPQTTSSSHPPHSHFGRSGGGGNIRGSDAYLDAPYSPKRKSISSQGSPRMRYHPSLDSMRSSGGSGGVGRSSFTKHPSHGNTSNNNGDNYTGSAQSWVNEGRPQGIGGSAPNPNMRPPASDDMNVEGGYGNGSGSGSVRGNLPAYPHSSSHHTSGDFRSMRSGSGRGRDTYPPRSRPVNRADAGMPHKRMSVPVNNTYSAQWGASPMQEGQWESERAAPSSASTSVRGPNGEGLLLLSQAVSYRTNDDENHPGWRGSTSEMRPARVVTSASLKRSRGEGEETIRRKVWDTETAEALEVYLPPPRYESTVTCPVDSLVFTDPLLFHTHYIESHVGRTGISGHKKAFSKTTNKWECNWPQCHGPRQADPNENVSSFECPQRVEGCKGYSGGKKDSLVSHIRSHHTHPPCFVCQVCFSYFNSKDHRKCGRPPKLWALVKPARSRGVRVSDPSSTAANVGTMSASAQSAPIATPTAPNANMESMETVPTRSESFGSSMRSSIQSTSYGDTGHDLPSSFGESFHHRASAGVGEGEGEGDGEGKSDCKGDRDVIAGVEESGGDLAMEEGHESVSGRLVMNTRDSEGAMSMDQRTASEQSQKPSTCSFDEGEGEGAEDDAYMMEDV
eukprot:CFRG7490T1